MARLTNCRAVALSVAAASSLAVICGLDVRRLSPWRATLQANETESVVLRILRYPEDGESGDKDDVSSLVSVQGICTVSKDQQGGYLKQQNGKRSLSICRAMDVPRPPLLILSTSVGIGGCIMRSSSPMNPFFRLLH